MRLSNGKSIIRQTATIISENGTKERESWKESKHFMGDSTAMSTLSMVKPKKSQARHQPPTWTQTHKHMYVYTLTFTHEYSFSVIRSVSHSDWSLDIYRFVVVGWASWRLIDDDSKPFQPNIKRWKLWSILFRKAFI